VLPNGNSAATITAGTLSGAGNPATSNYGTTYTYYGDTDEETTPTPLTGNCLASALVSQLGLLETVSPHGLHSTTTLYDAAGRPVKVTKAVGSTISCYDGEGRLLATEAPGDSEPNLFTYDPNGSLLTASHSGTGDDTAGTITNTYDEAGRLTDTVDANGAEASYTYDADGNLISRTAAKGALGSSTHYTTTYSYDDADQLASETDPAGSSFYFYYDDRGNLRGTQYPNGTFSWKDIDPLGETTDLYNRHGSISAATTSAPADSNPIADYSYSYNTDGQKSEQDLKIGTGATQVTTYAYDSLGRLWQNLLPSGTCVQYGYDLDSNRTQTQQSTTGCSGTFATTSSYSYTTGTDTPLDALTGQTGPTRSFGYDGGGTSLGDGNVTARGTDTFSWDGYGRLKGATTSPPTSLSEQFTVDGTNSGSPVTSSPYNSSLDTTTLSDGWHTIGASVTNENSKSAAAPAQVVYVQNHSTPAISLRHQLGGKTTFSSSTTVSLTITNPAPVGDTVIVAVDGGGLSSLSSVADSRGNSYTVDRPTVVGTGADIALASARITTALQSGDTITATYAAAPNWQAIAAVDFAGLTTASPWLDATASNTGRGETPSTGASGATTKTPELILGAFSDTTSSSTHFTPTVPFQSAINTLGYLGGIRIIYQVANGTGSFNASASYSGLPFNPYWAGTLATYRAASTDTTPPTTPGTPSPTVTPGTVALSWSASTDAGGLAYYHLYRSTTSGFTPGPGNEIGQTTQTSYVDNGDGTTNGLPAATYYYKVIAQDLAGNLSAASGQATAAVSADIGLPRTNLTAPGSGATVSGTTTLSANATDAAPLTTSVAYTYDPTGGLRSRTMTNPSGTTNYLLADLFETDGTGTITTSYSDGPAGDLAAYAGPPATGSTVSYLYYSDHGDLAAEANAAGTSTATHGYDAFGAPLDTPPANATSHRYTGQFDKQYDSTDAVVLMGARPYDPSIGRFLAVDPIDGGSLNNYDYAGQDPINSYDLGGTVLCSQCALDGGAAATRALAGTGTPGEPPGEPGPDSAESIAEGATGEGRANQAMLHLVRSPEELEGQNVQTVDQILQRDASEGNWSRVNTKNGPMWVSPDDKYQLRLSNAHGDWTLYSQLRNVPRVNMELGRANLTGSMNWP